MMLNIGLVFVTLVALVAAAHVQFGTPKKIQADKEYLTKQKNVLQLLMHVHQPVVVPELKEIANNYDLEQNINKFNDVECVRDFLKLYKNRGILSHDKIFTPLSENHVEQAKTVFEVLYNAKDWNTFLSTAVWLREHINDGLFVYAFSVAVLHRPDSKGLVIPPLYEVCPHLYIDTETIQKAYDARMKGASKNDVRDSTIILTNYTGWYDTKNPELRTSYFTEDVGLNFYHAIHHLSYPHWMKTEHCGIKNERQGELFYYVQQQILARYKMERSANHMYEMKNFTFEEPNIVAYTPHLRYKNGEIVPGRPENIKLQNSDCVDIERVKDFERRIRDAIDLGYVNTVKGEKVPLTTEQGIDTMGRLIEKVGSSVHPRYYGSLYHITLNLLGHISDPNHQNHNAPSVLQHFQTMLRDPMYYRLCQRINKLFTSYKNTLPKYTQETLAFPGVSIENVDVDKLMTFFDNFDIDITNAVTVGKVEDDKNLKIAARQLRLNHKEFTYRITVNSNQGGTGMVRVFLAPKYDVNGIRELSLNERKDRMIQIDRFPYEIKNGKTVIERSSKDSTVTVGDSMSFRVLYKKVEDALQGKSQFYVNDKGHEYGFPGRLLLPKGDKNGKQYVMYVVVTPYQPSGSNEQVRGTKTFVTCGGNTVCDDTYAMGFPFDRDVVETEFQVPNIYATDVSIYHKKTEDNTMDI